ncbi:hypothetical protein BaRGS_00028675 [Batillaria attramentaria]|uniref:Uncharacterized protein n=1 Tax=Batillaria attramentaria TaxID=370345 RepID=A0ABD0JYQ4_9CAEN
MSVPHTHYYPRNSCGSESHRSIHPDVTAVLQCLHCLPGELNPPVTARTLCEVKRPTTSLRAIVILLVTTASKDYFGGRAAIRSQSVQYIPTTSTSADERINFHFDTESAQEPESAFTIERATPHSGPGCIQLGVLREQSQRGLRSEFAWDVRSSPRARSTQAIHDTVIFVTLLAAQLQRHSRADVSSLTLIMSTDKDRSTPVSVCVSA